MKKRLVYGFLLTLLSLCVLFVVWEGSFNPGRFHPDNPSQTLIFWAVSSLTFLLMVILGWILCREFVKLYVERQSRRQGSRIKTKLVVGALTLSFVPVFFLVLFMYYAMNRNLATWFREPASKELNMFKDVSRQLDHEMTDETNAQAALLAAQPEVWQLLENGVRAPGFLERFAREYELESVAIFAAAGPESGGSPVDAWGPYRQPAQAGKSVAARAVVQDGSKAIGTVAVTARIPIDIGQTGQVIRAWAKEWSEDYQKNKDVRLLLHHADGADHAVRAVRRHLDRAVPFQADQHSHHGAAGGIERGAQGQSGLPRERARGR